MLRNSNTTLCDAGCRPARQSVAIAFTGGLTPYRDSFFWLVEGLLEDGLRAAGMAPEDPGGIRRPKYCAFVYQVSDWRAAVAALRDTAHERGLLMFAEIAWFDEAESFWRTVWPAAPAKPFERFWDRLEIAFAYMEIEAQDRALRERQ